MQINFKNKNSLGSDEINLNSKNRNSYPIKMFSYCCTKIYETKCSCKSKKMYLRLKFPVSVR